MKIKSCSSIVPLLLIALMAGGPFSPRADGKNAISYNNEGWEFLKKGDPGKAIFSFKMALRQNPNYRDAILGLGTGYLEVEAYDQSYDLFTRVLKIDKNSTPAMVGLGKTLAGMGDYSGAIKYFDRAIARSESNLDARYGLAYLYHLMGKKIWAKRNLENILRIDPYHFDSLLLMAEIKAGDNRLKEARGYVEKAIDSNADSPRGYITYGEILLYDYLAVEDDDILDEAKNALTNAISIQSGSYHANRIMGYIALLEKKYDEAVNFFKTALQDHDSGVIRYSLALSYDRAGDREAALGEFLHAYKLSPSDSILRGRFGDFLVFNDFKIGHPARMLLNRELHEVAMNRSKKNLPDQVVLYLRRTLLMNPMDVEARELLMDYYNVQNFNRFYIDEIKELLRLFPGNKYRDRLGMEIIKRRDRLYHREGFSDEVPPRDVPVVLVLDFDPEGGIPHHPDAGSVIGGSLTFALGQFGRMDTVGIRKRTALTCGLKCAGEHLDETLSRVEEMIKAGDMEQVDYIVYGTYTDTGSSLHINCSLLDFRKGFVIGEFSLSDATKESLQTLVLRSAKRIYSMIPFRGRILKLTDTGIVVNLGLYDGIAPGEKLVVLKLDRSRDLEKRRRMIIFTVKESDAIVCYAEPQKEDDLSVIDSADTVFPLKKRRAKKIE